MAGGGKLYASRQAWSECTTQLILICLLYSMGSIFFGSDGASFGGVQTFNPFVQRFGEYDSEKETWAIPTKIVSLINSLALIGKFIGAIIVGPIIEKLGHRIAMVITCVTQIVGAVSKCTSYQSFVSAVHRRSIIIYTAVGLVENVVPTYESEICPAPLRGFCVGSIQLFLTFGSLIAGIVNQYLSKSNTDMGWMLATGIQAVPALIILSGLYFTPTNKNTDSPRWLISKNRREEALAALRRLRPKKAVEDGLCELEVWALENSDNRSEKAPWVELFSASNWRRTSIALFLMALQQLPGVTFSSSYGPTFYKKVGLGDMAFTYAAVNNGVSVVTALIGMTLFDIFGRRELTFHGCWVQALFLCLIGGLGSKTNRSTGDTNGMVASFILYAAVLHATLGPAAYITAPEIGTAILREKTMAISTAFNVVVGFVVVYTTPYLLSTPGANLGAKLGYVWGGFAGAGAICVWFFMPELKGRNLEEIDQLFRAKLPAWRFKGYQCEGLDHEMAMYQTAGLKEKELKEELR
ncbi:general substrate transporter [Aspergillus steynii IBT 23096]|uniref:General substrate transporter n=1 Tax=Aspergillus steynii IBT 23096 TaxID=1392250 RepID=A0A2I2G8B1_9EURO|nr:general substrate transporter [Aspergillus steynii IBT 23096]PLB49104.1 general substrate transporter [Aspergillus steynii IBT 23096]